MPPREMPIGWQALSLDGNPTRPAMCGGSMRGEVAWQQGERCMRKACAGCHQDGARSRMGRQGAGPLNAEGHGVLALYGHP
jgi:mono/diheme cytochrome c family protein